MGGRLGHPAGASAAPALERSTEIMTDDAHEEHFRHHDEILRSLTAMLVRMDGYLARQDMINERLTNAIERLDTTQARIETLLARMIPPGDNGRDARARQRGQAMRGCLFGNATHARAL